MIATCYIDGWLRINLDVVKKNHHTVWVKTYRKPYRYGKEVTTFVKRHIVKHNVELKGD